MKDIFDVKWDLCQGQKLNYSFGYEAAFEKVLAETPEQHVRVQVMLENMKHEG